MSRESLVSTIYGWYVSAALELVRRSENVRCSERGSTKPLLGPRVSIFNDAAFGPPTATFGVGGGRAVDNQGRIALSWSEVLGVGAQRERRR